MPDAATTALTRFGNRAASPSCLDANREPQTSGTHERSGIPANLPAKTPGQTRSV